MGVERVLELLEGHETGLLELTFDQYLVDHTSIFGSPT